MNIFLACPAPSGSLKGNRVTAERWAGILKLLGHRVTIRDGYNLKPCDVMIALHARRSFSAITRYRRFQPQGPLVVALTGTDLYRDIRTSKRAQHSLELADRLVVLQPMGLEEIPARLRSKGRVIYQSAEPVGLQPPNSSDPFKVVILGHLRHEKDPFRTALALRLLPSESRIQVTHLGRALNDVMWRRAKKLSTTEPRYRWLGEVRRSRARKILAQSHLLVLSSRMEGGANAISEAVADGVPILASRISGSIGLLGARYPGFFETGDTLGLARLLTRAESDPRYYDRLKQWCANLAPLVAPAREQASWQYVLSELTPG